MKQLLKDHNNRLFNLMQEEPALNKALLALLIC
jgi:hypothetical protein